MAPFLPSLHICSLKSSILRNIITKYYLLQSTKLYILSKLGRILIDVYICGSEGTSGVKAYYAL